MILYSGIRGHVVWTLVISVIFGLFVWEKVLPSVTSAHPGLKKSLRGQVLKFVASNSWMTVNKHLLAHHLMDRDSNRLCKMDSRMSATSRITRLWLERTFTPRTLACWHREWMTFRTWPVHTTYPLCVSAGTSRPIVEYFSLSLATIKN
jgi:hypothetical protein